MNDLNRADVIKLIAIATKPLNLRGVNLESVDLSKLDLTGAVEASDVNDYKKEVEKLSNGKIKVDIQKGYGNEPFVVYSLKEGDGMTTKIKPSEGDPTNMAYTDNVILL